MLCRECKSCCGWIFQSYSIHPSLSRTTHAKQFHTLIRKQCWNLFWSGCLLDKSHHTVKTQQPAKSWTQKPSSQPPPPSSLPSSTEGRRRRRRLLRLRQNGASNDAPVSELLTGWYRSERVEGTYPGAPPDPNRIRSDPTTITITNCINLSKQTPPQHLSSNFTTCKQTYRNRIKVWPPPRLVVWCPVSNGAIPPVPDLEPWRGVRFSGHCCAGRLIVTVRWVHSFACSLARVLLCCRDFIVLFPTTTSEPDPIGNSDGTSLKVGWQGNGFREYCFSLVNN